MSKEMYKYYVFKQFMTIYFSKCSGDIVVLILVKMALYLLNNLSTLTNVIGTYLISATIESVQLDENFHLESLFIIKDNYFNFW